MALPAGTSLYRFDGGSSATPRYVYTTSSSPSGGDNYYDISGNILGVIFMVEVTSNYISIISENYSNTWDRYYSSRIDTVSQPDILPAGTTLYAWYYANTEPYPETVYSILPSPYIGTYPGSIEVLYDIYGHKLDTGTFYTESGGGEGGVGGDIWIMSWERMYDYYPSKHTTVQPSTLYVSKLSNGSDVYDIKDANAIHTLDISSTYSPTGTAPINGIAVASAINGMTITSINTNPALTSSGGICTWTITESKSPICECIIYETSTGKEVFPDISYGSGSITIKINSESNISANTYTAIVIG